MAAAVTVTAVMMGIATTILATFTASGASMGKVTVGAASGVAAATVAAMVLVLAGLTAVVVRRRRQ